MVMPLLVWADFKISDGSVLNGKILGLVDGNLTIETAFAGKIVIPFLEISSITSDNEISLRLDDNRTFDGLIDKAEENQLSIRGNSKPLPFLKLNIFGMLKQRILLY